MKQGIKRPQPMPYTLNNAVDYLLKQEFDIHREKGTPHPVMEKYDIDAIPYQHEKIYEWRQNFVGVQYHHKLTDFLVTGAVDDVWINPKKELMVVDYKATGANQHQVYDSYKRQMEVYQWLFRQNKFLVSPIGYFVFARVNKGAGFGSGKAALSFELFIEPHKGDDSWLEETLLKARKTFELEKAPAASPNCEYCRYRTAAAVH